jgi:caffeoyl-CoA O-methyltransferase
MSNRTLNLTPDLYLYLLEQGVRESDVARRLREETAKLPMAMMQISAEQGQFMRLLVELIGARRAVEVGTFTGYSALCVAEAMGPQGRLIACDVSEEYTAVARRYWARAGVAERIDLRLGPAVATLDALLAKGAAGSIDFVFIDANKTDYDAYFERALRLLRPGGLIAVDNVLWGGSVADPTVDDEDTNAIRALNRKLAADERVSLSLLPIGDGLTLARKRP